MLATIAMLPPLSSSIEPNCPVVMGNDQPSALKKMERKKRRRVREGRNQENKGKTPTRYKKDHSVVYVMLTTHHVPLHLPPIRARVGAVHARYATRSTILKII